MSKKKLTDKDFQRTDRNIPKRLKGKQELMRNKRYKIEPNEINSILNTEEGKQIGILEKIVPDQIVWQETIQIDPN